MPSPTDWVKSELLETPLCLAGKIQAVPESLPIGLNRNYWKRLRGRLRPSLVAIAYRLG